MPDIAMCKGVTKTSSCRDKNICYRYTAEPNPYRQSYFMEAPLKEDGSCEYYLPSTPQQHATRVTKRQTSEHDKL